MRTVYVLVANSEAALQGVRGTVYAVFDDKETAERMKRDGDEVVEVPYFIELSAKVSFPSTTITTDRTWVQPLNTPSRTNDPLPDSSTKVWC